MFGMIEDWICPGVTVKIALFALGPKIIRMILSPNAENVQISKIAGNNFTEMLMISIENAEFDGF